MDWKECVERRLAKKIHADIALINSLKETSKNKSISAASLEISEVTSSSVITLCYDSLRELLEALAIKHCYKIYNHECYTCFLKSVLSEEEIADAYDRIRKIRNAINYYGRKISIEEAEATIGEIKNLINLCKRLLDK
ncbi:hypothetical protein J4458_04095 [Candidatus Woesearchaeota archaeon]|nr:hypothetical protein [Candidatus Woesearchaeota archaeon]